MSWLDWEPPPGVSDDQKNHMASRFDRGDTGTVSFTKREAGRAEAVADPAYRQLLDWEIPQDQPEPQKM